MAILIEHYLWSRESRLGPSYIFRASCDLCGCAGLGWAVGLFPRDAYAELEAHGHAREQGWVQRYGGARGHILQSVCPHCQQQELQAQAEGATSSLSTCGPASHADGVMGARG